MFLISKQAGGERSVQQPSRLTPAREAPVYFTNDIYAVEKK
jgi:hypothetical protein